MEQVWNHLVALAGAIGLMALAHFGWVISGVGNKRIKNRKGKWSWSRFLDDLIILACFSVSMFILVITLDFSAYYVRMLEIEAFNAVMEVASYGTIIAVPLAATYYLDFRALKNNKSIAQYDKAIQELGIDDSNGIKFTDNTDQIAQNIMSTVNDITQLYIPKGLADKHLEFEETGGRGRYYPIDITSYDTFRASTLGKGFDVDSAWGAQCLTAGHLVAMADGTYLPVEELTEGDIVWGGKTVVSNNPKESEVLHVRTSLGHFYCTPDHKCVLKDGTIKLAKALTSGRVDRNHKDSLMVDTTPITAKYALTDDELRFLGFWLGDGTKVYRHGERSHIPQVFVTVGTPAKEHYLEELEVALNKRLHSNKKAHIYTIVNKEHPTLAQLIHTLDNKELPRAFSPEQYKHIIEGYLMADGSVKHHGWCARSADKTLLVGIQYGCFVNGWKAVLSQPYERPTTNLCDHPKPYWELTINPNCLPEANVIDVEWLEDPQTVYVLNLDGDHLYSADNLIHHNCWDLCAVLWQQLGQSLLTGNGCAYGCWTLKRDANSNPNFELISNKKDVKRGDVVVFGGGEFGHIGLADEDYNGGAYIRLLGQNQGGTAYAGGGSTTNVINVSMAGFLGAFRYKGWIKSSTSSTPEKKPETTPATPTAEHDGFNIGDKVVPTKLVDAFGTKLTQYDDYYVITGWREDVNGAILSIRGQIWAVLPFGSFKKA